jgi:hypothetical protein
LVCCGKKNLATPNRIKTSKNQNWVRKKIKSFCSERNFFSVESVFFCCLLCLSYFKRIETDDFLFQKSFSLSLIISSLIFLLIAEKCFFFKPGNRSYKIEKGGIMCPKSVFYLKILNMCEGRFICTCNTY